MFSFVQGLFSQPTNPIGLDFGTDSLRLAQVQKADGDYRLVAAASADVPADSQHDPKARLEFFASAVRELMSQAPFRGRQVVLGLPSASTYVTDIRIPIVDEASLKRELPAHLRTKFPFDPDEALLRHIIAGEVSANEYEVIVLAAERKAINDLLKAAQKARLDVIGMNVEALAIIDCFGHVFRRRNEEDLSECFIDMGSRGTRAIIAQSGRVRLVRQISIGGDDFTAAVAATLNMDTANARTLRIKLASAAQSRAARAAMAQVTTLNAPRQGQPAAAAMGLECPREEAQQAQLVMDACRPIAARLIEQLNECRKYYQTTFNATSVDRLIFVGGEARQRTLCEHIAKELDLTAQLGDPLCRMARYSEVSIESGIDRRTPQPAWAVAVGLSLGAVQLAVKA